MTMVVQEKILASASKLFAAQGYQHVSLRQIASDAGVAASIIIRHFQSKEKLFLKVMSIRIEDTDFFDGPKNTAGAAIVKSTLASTSDPTSTLRSIGALMDAVDSDEAKNEISKALTKILIQPLVNLMDGEQKEVRASLITAQITGLLVHMYKLQSPILSEDEQEIIIHYYGQAIQAIIDAN